MTTHPDLEELAAYIDCTLPAEDRARVTAHLADCEDCYFVFSETVHFQQQESEPSSSRGGNVTQFPFGGTVGKPQPFWRRAPALVGLPVAAALLAVVGFAVYQNYFGPPPAMHGAELVGFLQGQRGDRWPGARSRGEKERIPGEPTRSPEEPFKLGVALVDLQATVQAGDAEDAQDALARINGLLEEEDFLDAEKGYYLKAGTDLYQARRPPAKILEELRRTSPAYEARLDKGFSFGSPYIPFGKWAEAGWISVGARNREFFESRANRRFPAALVREIERQQDVPLDSEVVQSLEDIEDLWSTGAEGKPAKDLEAAFAQILRFYAGGGPLPATLPPAPLALDTPQPAEP